MESPWFLPIAALLLGGGGIGTLLGFFVTRQQNRMQNSATAVGQSIDGLTRLTQELRAELDRAYRRIADLEKKQGRAK